MFKLPQIHSDIRDQNFENEEQEIASAEKAVGGAILGRLLSIAIIGLIIAVVVTLGPIAQNWPLLMNVMLFVLLGLFFGGIGFTLWKLSRS